MAESVREHRFPNGTGILSIAIIMQICEVVQRICFLGSSGVEVRVADPRRATARSERTHYMVPHLPSDQEDRTPRTDRGRGMVLLADLVALALILSAVVAIVVFGSASTAVISSAGGAIALAFRAWRAKRAEDAA